MLFPVHLSIASAPVIMSQQPKISPQAALERLFTAPEIERQWFADSFLSQVPVSPEQIIRDLQNQLGPFQSLQSEGEGYRVVFERGSLAALIRLDETEKISSLWFHDIRSNAIALPDAIEQFQALPGQVSLLVVETTETPTGSGIELASLNADQPMAVGSTFKLAILAALHQEIQAGRYSWADVVALEPQDKSLPSGILQDWFDGALLTVQTLATLMISQSDNTATDLLIRWVGREKVEEFAPRNRPFLTTREAFVLKAAPNASLLTRYRAGNETERRQLLSELVQVSLPEVTSLSDRPTALDVEWFFTARELCSLIGQVSDLPLTRVNPGISPAGWSQVAYKGGSEPGVLNLTNELVSQTGKRYCVSATWNDADAPLDENHFFTLYSSMVSGLQDAGLQDANR